MQDQAKQRSLNEVKVSYDNDHGYPIENDFDQIHEKALGAASLAQVHKARKKATGEICAVKLQYPELKWQTKIDIFVIRQISKLANRLCRYYKYTGVDFVKFMAHFEKSLLQELDFKQEVINTIRVQDHFSGYDGLYVPKVHILMSTKRSIVMEYVEGDKIDDLEALAKKYGKATAATD